MHPLSSPPPPPVSVALVRSWRRRRLGLSPFFLFLSVSACVSPKKGFSPVLRSRYHSRIVAPWLVSSAKVVAHLEGEAAALRYFSTIETQDGIVWLFAKNGTYPHAATKSSVVAFDSCWSPRCLNSPRLVLDGTSESHNFAVTYQHGHLLGFGGMLTSTKHEISPRELVGDPPAFAPAVSSGLLPKLVEPVRGCVEMRRGKTCEFDGRFSLASLNNETLLYARANAREEGGGRFVQVAIAEGKEWSPFQKIQFLKGDQTLYQSVFSSPSETIERADLYFASVEPNPALDGSLLAFFPTVVRTSQDRLRDWKAHAAILLSLSLDGLTFSPPVTLLKASPAGGEINDHVVDGVILRGDHLHFFVHSGVPGTLVKLCPFRYLHRLHEPPSPRVTANAVPYDNSTTRGEDQHLFPPPPPPSHIVRYTIRMDALRNWSFQTAANLPR